MFWNNKMSTSGRPYSFTAHSSHWRTWSVLHNVGSGGITKQKFRQRGESADALDQYNKKNVDHSQTGEILIPCSLTVWDVWEGNLSCWVQRRIIFCEKLLGKSCKLCSLTTNPLLLSCFSHLILPSCFLVFGFFIHYYPQINIGFCPHAENTVQKSI